MATATATRPVEPGAAPPEGAARRVLPRWGWAVVVLGVWTLAWMFTKHQQTLAIPGVEYRPFHARISEIAANLKQHKDSNPLMLLSQTISTGVQNIFEFCRNLIGVAKPPAAAPGIGWLGVTAIASWVAYAVANWRIALLVAGTFFSFGLFGYWSDSMDLLIITALSVLVAAILAFPLVVFMAVSDRGNKAITVVLDLLQTLPTFVYIVPVILFFGIGPPASLVCTLAYALPPVVRIASFGIRNAAPTVVEATNSLGQTTWQRLMRVQVPMARSTIILGLNQTTLAALSMAVIASYINGPGLGKPVLDALTIKDVGAGVVPGLLIVAMGIMLDRATSAASERSERAARSGAEDLRFRRLLLAGLLIPVFVAVWYSRYALNAAIFPRNAAAGWVAGRINTVTDRVVNTLQQPAGAFKDFISTVLLNPLQSLLAESPWWISLIGLLLLSLVIGGRRAAVVSTSCLAGIAGLQLWHDAMLTLTMTLVAAVLVTTIGVLVGVWMGRSTKVDLVIRPVLDAAQIIPAFVYLLPILALFGPNRFTAIMAGVIYAAPAATKIVADGIRGLPAGTIEAGRSLGTTKRQEIFGIQLPMAKGSLLLAANQGLLYVLAMVVIGAMVGAQALGYAVILSVSHVTEYWGKGVCAGLSIALLGMWLDRVMRAAAAREDGGAGSTTGVRTA